PRVARDVGEHLVPACMEMPERIDGVDPGSLPTILAVKRRRRAAAAGVAGQPAAPEDQRQPAVGNAAVRLENLKHDIVIGHRFPPQTPEDWAVDRRVNPLPSPASAAAPAPATTARWPYWSWRRE